MIAFSRFATKQLALKAHTLNQTMINKVKAFLDRGEIRDCFDIKFLLRKGNRVASRYRKKNRPAFKKA
jgi:hypothetical protein